MAMQAAITTLSTSRILTKDRKEHAGYSLDQARQAPSAKCLMSHTKGAL